MMFPREGPPTEKALFCGPTRWTSLTDGTRNSSGGPGRYNWEKTVLQISWPQTWRALKLTTINLELDLKEISISCKRGNTWQV